VRPRLLDLFCKAGGAGMGYSRAGFDVVGVDIEPQSRYPFTFVQADALEYLAAHGREFDVIHASPPCQIHSRCRRIGNAKPSHRDYIEPTRQLLNDVGRNYVIENVEGAPLAWPITLCGSMFGLPLIRHRIFESTVLLFVPGSCTCHQGERFGVYAGKVTRINSRATPYLDSNGRTHWRPQMAPLSEGKRAMGIDWMSRDELSQAIPPAYTEFIGKQLLAALEATT